MHVPYVIEATDNGNDKVYDLYSRLLKDRVIFVTGVFEDQMANSIVAQLLFLNSVAPEEDIMMYINSPGGSINSMYAIYDTMQYVSNDIVTVGMGTVASAGSFILAAGTSGKRKCLPNTEVMIHELSGGFEGKANDIFLTAERTKKYYDRMAKYYVKFTGQKLAKVKKDMERDYYMSADETKEYGLIDDVISSPTKA